MTTHAAPIAHRRRSWASAIRPEIRVALFGVGLAALGAALLAATPAPTTRAAGGWHLPLIVLALAFAAAEATALHVEIRKESHSLSLGAIPLMFGLVLCSPVELTIAYVIGAAPVLLLVRRSGWLKTFWNSCLFVAEAGIAAFTVRSLLGVRVPASGWDWLVPLAGVLLAELVSLFAVALVIMVVDATFRPHLFADVGQSQILAALAGTFTVTVASASIACPPVAIYAIVPILGVGMLLRHTGRISQRLKDVQQLHRFTSVLANERGIRTLDTGLVELAQIMRSRSAGLMITARAGQSASLRLLDDDRIHDLDGDPMSRLLTALVDDDVSLITLDDQRPDAAALLQTLGASTIVATRVLGEADQCGVLFVVDRLGMREQFTSDELRLFRSLASTLSARLSNDLLVERLEAQARSDALTGLPNRLSFEVALTSALAKADQAGLVIMVDLDRFKEVNDSLGHDTGDRLLIELAGRLRSVARSTDVVARFGGDEFALMLVCNGSEPAALQERVAAIHRLLTDRIEIDGIRFDVGASLGVAIWPAQGHDSATLLRHADTAMYEAKRNQLGPVWYSPDLDVDAPRRLDLYMSSSDAFGNDQLEVVFQPKISATDGRVTGAEALARWHHPTWGDISPTEFVPLMVHAGVIGKLTRFVIRRAAEAALTLREAGYDMPIAVNLTPRDLLDPRLVDDIDRILAAIGASPSSLLIEITEDAMVVDIDTAVSVLARLRGMGVRVAIDDFGTGYSSLQHLHRLPIDQLKIDGSFVRRMSVDDSACAIVRASVNLANDLGLETVAEGVEDAAAFAQLRQMGCGEVQGFLVNPGLSLPTLLAWVDGWDPHSMFPSPRHDEPDHHLAPIRYPALAAR